MKKRSLKLSALTAGLILAGTTAFTLVGCGGGSSSTSTTPMSSISGTVPGTLIEAFCEDGSYYVTESDDSIPNEPHPFELEIPSNLSCSLVMTTNEDNNETKIITQIGVITPDANGTLFTATGDIDLGYIPLAMEHTPEIDEDDDHVADEILLIDVNGTLIEIELENPLDDDNDGLVNVYEDDDDDGINNHDDDDDNGDGEIDVDNDLDDDGIDNDVDVDDDNDGLHDDDDYDDDNDGIYDDEDDDDDNDGIEDDLDDDYSDDYSDDEYESGYVS